MTFDISKVTIPTDPGIYLMRDSDDKIIYIGKAKNLKTGFGLILTRIKITRRKN